MTKSIVASVGLVLTLSFILFSSRTADARAQTSTGTIALEQVLSGLSSPVYLTSARDSSNRLFIVEQGGRIKILANGASLPTVFLDIAERHRLLLAALRRLEVANLRRRTAATLHRVGERHDPARRKRLLVRQHERCRR